MAPDHSHDQRAYSHRHVRDTGWNEKEDSITSRQGFVG